MIKGFDRNYWILVLEGVMFTGGIIALSTGAVVAIFVNTMTGSNTLIGLAVTLQALLLAVGQLIGAPFIGNIRKLPAFLFKGMAIQRAIPLFMALPLFLGVSGYAAVTIFMILFALFWGVDGTITLSWGELCARALKPELRSHMMGMQATLGGVLSLAVGLVFTWMLATPTLNDEYRFGFIFILGSILLLSTIIFIRLVRDPNPTEKPEKTNYKQFYSEIPNLVKSCKPLQRILIARIPSYIGFAAISFVIVYGINILSLSDSQASWLVYAGIIGGIISGVALGEVSRMFGNKAIIIICNCAVVVVIVMAVMLTFVSSLGYIWLFVTCMLASFTGNHWFGYFNYFIDIAPVKNRAAYQLIGQCVGIPFSFIGLVMGVIVDRFGFISMFVICGVFAFVSVIFSLRLLSKDKMTELQIAREG